MWTQKYRNRKIICKICCLFPRPMLLPPPKSASRINEPSSSPARPAALSRHSTRKHLDLRFVPKLDNTKHWLKENTDRPRYVKQHRG